MTRPRPAVAGLLLDLEGTLFAAGRPLPGAADALRWLEEHALPFAVVTNTTTRPRSALARELAAAGLPVDRGRILTPAVCARDYLLARGHRRCHLLAPPALLEDLPGIEAVEEGPQAVVVGDLGAGFTFDRLCAAFRMVLAGAELVALARNRYFRAPEGLRLDAGPFVAALEYATGREAALTGKPSPLLFGRALALLGLPAESAAVVGDDIEGDVGGAQAAGMRGFLVRTGKFREDDEVRTGIRPDAVLSSLAELPSALRVSLLPGGDPA